MRLVGKKVAARLARDGPNADTMSTYWKVIILRDPCVYCGRRSSEMDHIRPRARGGKNGWTNIAPTCKACNTMKSDGLLWWMLWRLNEMRLGFVREQPIRWRRLRNGQREVLDTMTIYTRRLLRAPKSAEVSR